MWNSVKQRHVILRTHLLVVICAIGRQRPARLRRGKVETSYRVGLLGGGAASTILLELAKFELHVQGRSLVWGEAARVGKDARCCELGDQNNCRRRSDVEMRVHGDQTTTAAAAAGRWGWSGVGVVLLWW